MRPELLENEFTEQLAVHMVDFYNDLRNGERPRLALFTPPQHGKSTIVRDFIGWASGRTPQLKTIFASYSDELGQVTNRELQRMLSSPQYTNIFSHMHVGAPGWRMTSDVIEYPGFPGYFRNTTVRGSITGLGLDLGVIDDPHKGRQEAYSPQERDKVWHWFTSDFLTRMSNSAGILVIMTRWHIDDLMGRYFTQFPQHNFKVVKFPAIAEHDSAYRKRGEALFPALKSLEFLNGQRRIMTEGAWQALYQQSPIVSGGGIIPIEKLRVLNLWDKSKIRRTVRYIDKAATPDGPGAGAYTAMVLMHVMYDKSFVISHIIRGHWGALEREEKIKAVVEADASLYHNYEVGIEQEPGSGGKESAELTVRNLAGKRAYADRVTGSKEIRAESWIAQVQNDNVKLIAGDWVHAFRDECESWPAGARTDRVDAAAGAFNRLVVKAGYDTMYRAFDPNYKDEA